MAKPRRSKSGAVGASSWLRKASGTVYKSGQMRLKIKRVKPEITGSSIDKIVVWIYKPDALMKWGLCDSWNDGERDLSKYMAKWKAKGYSIECSV